MYFNTFESPWGEICLEGDGQNLTGLYFHKPVVKKQELKVFTLTQKWLERYFNHKMPEINEIPILLQGSDFRLNVWNLLAKIPYGEVTTYGEIASKIANKKGLAKMSAQAVGGAIGSNPLSIIIPCHRVIGKNNSLTGYAGGLDIKYKLLEHEGIDMSRFH